MTNPDTEPSARPSIAARVNRMPVIRAHRFAVIVIGLGLFFDTYEVFLSGTLSAVLEDHFTLGQDSLKLVLASAFVGQFLGAILLGRVADRIGRRNAFLLNLLIYSFFSLVGGLAPNAAVLIISRFLAGFGLGAELVLADTYLSEILPPKVRARFLAMAYTISFCGIPVVAFLARGLVPLQPLGLDGWRWLFIIGALGAVIVWILRRRLPESPRWLESVGRVEEAGRLVDEWEKSARTAGLPLPEPNPEERPTAAERLPVRKLFSGVYGKRTFMLWVLNGLEVFAYYGFGTIGPLVLVSKGYSVVGSLLFLALSYIGYPLGSALSLPIVERVERKVLIAVTAGGMAVTGLLFGFAPSPVLVVVWGFLFTLVSNIFSNAFHAYLPELYPTALRATAAGSAYSISRITTAALPFILLPVLSAGGAGAVFGIVAAAMVLLILDVLILGPRTTGRTLELVTDAAAPLRASAPDDAPRP